MEFDPVHDHLMQLPDSDMFYELPPREKCFSHTLSLIATTDVTKAKFGEHWRLAGKKGTAQAKVTALWNVVNWPKSAEIIKAALDKMPPTPCATRWNSLHDSLRFLLDYSLEKINKLLKDLGLPELKDVEWEYLQEYYKCLAPLAVAIDKCQGEHSCFYGMGIPIIAKVKKELQQLQISNLKFCKQVVELALEGLERRFGHFLTQDESVLDAMIATMSHPLFKLRKIHNDKRQDMTDQLITIAQKLAKQERKEANEQQPESAKDPFFDSSDDEEHGGEPSQDGGQRIDDRVKIEVLNYLVDTDRSLEMLHRYESVKRVFVKYNTALISSAPVERLFSFGSLILKGRRGRLTDKNFEKLLMLKAMSAMSNLN